MTELAETSRLAPAAPSGARSILFLRALPRRVAAGNLRPWAPHRIEVFWIGFGRRVRVPGAALLERMRGGEFSDVVDIGVAGALDPRLGRGDLVLSTLEVPSDSREPLAPRRRPGVLRVARQLASQRGVALDSAPVLTHREPVLSRRDRLAWLESTGCAAVQMEHAWGLRLLGSLLPAAVLRSLCFTHLVMISDPVPAGEGWLESVRGAGRALSAYVLQRSVRRLREDFLTMWLLPGGCSEQQSL